MRLLVLMILLAGCAGPAETQPEPNDPPPSQPAPLPTVTPGPEPSGPPANGSTLFVFNESFDLVVTTGTAGTVGTGDNGGNCVIMPDSMRIVSGWMILDWVPQNGVPAELEARARGEGSMGSQAGPPGVNLSLDAGPPDTGDLGWGYYFSIHASSEPQVVQHDVTMRLHLEYEAAEPVQPEARDASCG